MKKFKETINELKKTDRGRAIIRLSYYMLFFLFVIILCAIANAMSTPTSNESKPTNGQVETPQEVETEPLTYMDKQEKIINGEYEYVYKITGEITATYTGTHKKDIDSGFKETTSETYKYVIENGQTYKQIMDEKTPIDDLYKGLDSNLFDFKLLFEKLNSKTTIIERTPEAKIYKYENIEEYTYKIHTTELGITKIEIESSGLKYEFTFTF